MRLGQYADDYARPLPSRLGPLSRGRERENLRRPGRRSSLHLPGSSPQPMLQQDEVRGPEGGCLALIWEPARQGCEKSPNCTARFPGGEAYLWAGFGNDTWSLRALPASTSTTATTATTTRGGQRSNYRFMHSFKTLILSHQVSMTITHSWETPRGGGPKCQINGETSDLRGLGSMEHASRMGMRHTYALRWAAPLPPCETRLSQWLPCGTAVCSVLPRAGGPTFPL